MLMEWGFVAVDTNTCANIEQGMATRASTTDDDATGAAVVAAN